MQTRRLLLDPAIHEGFETLKNLVEEKEKKAKKLQDNVAAVNFPPTSRIGKLLMAKGRTLQEENEETGAMASEGKHLAIDDFSVDVFSPLVDVQPITPSATVPFLSTTDKTPQRSRLWPGGSLSRLQAPSSNYDFKDDMDVFSPLVDVQPITLSLGNWWDDHEEEKMAIAYVDKKSAVLRSSTRRFPFTEGSAEPHAISDWRLTSRQDGDHVSESTVAPVASSKSESSFSPTPREAWGGQASQPEQSFVCYHLGLLTWRGGPWPPFPPLPLPLPLPHRESQTLPYNAIPSSQPKDGKKKYRSIQINLRILHSIILNGCSSKQLLLSYRRRWRRRPHLLSNRLQDANNRARRQCDLICGRSARDLLFAQVVPASQAPTRGHRRRPRRRGGSLIRRGLLVLLGMQLSSAAEDCSVI